MNYTLNLLLLFSFLLYQHGKNDDPVLKIEVVKADFSNEPIFNIDCGNLESSFPVDTFYIFDQEKINRILNFISKAKPFNIRNGFDSRAKMYVYYQSKKIDTFCIGNTIPFYYNNTPMIFEDRDLIKMLDSLEKK